MGKLRHEPKFAAYSGYASHDSAWRTDSSGAAAAVEMTTACAPAAH